MKIVVFSEKFWPEGSGGELATYLILKLLAPIKDFELEVYTGTQNPAQVSGISVKTVDFLRASNKIQLFLNILANKQYIEKIIKKADLVYIPSSSYPVIPISKGMSKRVIVHLHGYQPISYTAVIFSIEVNKPMNNFKRTLILESKSGNILRSIASAVATPLTKVIKTWIGMADKIICVSRRHEEILLRFVPEYRGKTTIIYNPPPEIPNVKKDLSEKPTLLYVGGDSYIKGFYVLLEALEILGRRKQTNFKLILANKYSQKSLKIIENLKKKYGLDIQVLGRISYEELIKLHARTWALLFPSIWEEPLPYAITESLLAGTLPLASKVGGVVEIVENTIANEFLFSFDNIHEFVDRIEKIISMDKQHILELSLKLQQSASLKFNDKDLTKKLLEVFR